jgi:uncharacterized membrane protein YgdD (TMEM256/DUF423 family)
MNRILAAGALLGLLSVIIGAASEHALQARLEPEVFRWVMTAIRYHQIGALVVTGIGLALLASLPRATARDLHLAGWLFVIGTVLFSFSIYLAALSGFHGLTLATPVGGVTLMLAWSSLVWAGWRHKCTAAGDA